MNHKYSACEVQYTLDSHYPQGGVAPSRHALALHTYQQKKHLHAADPDQPFDVLGLLSAGLARLLALQRRMSTCAMPSSSYGAETVAKPKLA